MLRPHVSVECARSASNKATSFWPPTPYSSVRPPAVPRPRACQRLADPHGLLPHGVDGARRRQELDDQVGGGVAREETLRRATDPWFFLLRSLRDNGWCSEQVDRLAAPDGRVALERGRRRGPGSTRTWRRRNSMPARGCSTVTPANTYGAQHARGFPQRPSRRRLARAQEYQRARILMKYIAETALVPRTSRRACRSPTSRKERTKFPIHAGCIPRDAPSAVAVIVKDEHLAVPGADLDGHWLGSGCGAGTSALGHG